MHDVMTQIMQYRPLDWSVLQEYTTIKLQGLEDFVVFLKRIFEDSTSNPSNNFLAMNGTISIDFENSDLPL